MPHGLGVRSVCSRGVMRNSNGLHDRGFLWHTKCVATHVQRRLQRHQEQLPTTAPALAQDAAQDAEVTSALSALYGTGSFGLASESLVELEARYMGDLARL